jgi:hypothetical protein
MKTKQYIDFEEQYGAHNYHPLDVVIRRGKGVWVYDVEGKKYLDCLSAYSALNQGHCHPKIQKAVTDQSKRVTLTSRAFRNDQLPLLYKALHDLTGYDMALPMNSGAEAVETAIKAARKWAYTVKGVSKHLAEIICCSGNFHGRTTTIVGFSTEEQYREGFGPFTPGFRIVKYGDIEDLRKNISSNTAAFLVEPIQGEAGIVVPPEGYLREAARLCKEHNVLLIADEIQTGLGRCGKLFAFRSAVKQGDPRRFQPGGSRVNVRRQSPCCGYCRSFVERHREGETDPTLLRARRILYEEAESGRELAHQTNPRQGFAHRTGSGYESQTLLRRACKERRSVQGNTRKCYPICTTAHYHGKRD